MEFPRIRRAISPVLVALDRFASGRIAVFRSGTRGGSLVEFALTMPIMMLVITGVFTFSVAIYQKLELSEAVAAGGRVIAADRGDTNPCATTATAIENAAPTLNSANMTFSFSINGGTATGATCTGSAGANNMAAGGTASVKATYTCVLHAYRFSFPGCVVSSQIVEEVQ